VQEHDRMIALLGARDGAGLRQVLVEHLEHKRDAVLDQMAAAGAAEARAVPA